MRLFKGSRAAIAGIGLAAALGLTGVAAAQGDDSQLVVTPDRLRQWSITNTGQTVEFVSGPATPPLGKGSLRLATLASQGDKMAEIRTHRYDGVKLENLTELRYSSYVTAWNGQQAPYLVLSVDTDGKEGADDTLLFEPGYQTHTSGNASLDDQGAVQLNTWQRWDALKGGWWSLRDFQNTSGEPANQADPGTGVKSLASYIERYPEARIAPVVRDGVELGGLRLAVGGGSVSDSFDGNVDAVTVDTAGRDTRTFDFEPKRTSSGGDDDRDDDDKHDRDRDRGRGDVRHDDKERCKKGGWATAFEDGRFKNQGQCVSHFARGGDHDDD